MHRISIVLVVVGCAADPVPEPAAVPRHSVPTHYGVVEAPSGLGGTNSRANSAARGAIAGFSSLADNATRHAAVWRDGLLVDLGTLGGPNSNVAWPGQSPRGELVAGIAETADDQPNGEEWSCSAFFPSVTHKVCRGFAWSGAALVAMPTLCGDNSFATGANDRGQVVGWAETTVRDPSCTAPQVLGFLAVVWEPARATIRALAPLPGESATAATAINGRGQTVGISGACDVAVGRFSAAHAVLWDEAGAPHDLGSLGGTSWNTPMAINEHGDIAGFSNLPGDDDGTFAPHATLWTRERGAVDLGLLAGDDFSEALDLDEARTIVGVSCGAAGCRAVIWHDGPPAIPLASLVGPGFPDTLVGANAIDDTGRIAGRVKLAAGGATVPFVATPVD